MSESVKLVGRFVFTIDGMKGKGKATAVMPRNVDGDFKTKDAAHVAANDAALKFKECEYYLKSIADFDEVKSIECHVIVLEQKTLVDNAVSVDVPKMDDVWEQLSAIQKRQAGGKKKIETLA